MMTWLREMSREAIRVHREWMARDQSGPVPQVAVDWDRLRVILKIAMHAVNARHDLEDIVDTILQEDFDGPVNMETGA